MRGTLAFALSSIDGGASFAFAGESGARSADGPQHPRHGAGGPHGTMAAALDVAKRLKANHFESRVDGKVKQAAIRATA